MMFEILNRINIYIFPFLTCLIILIDLYKRGLDQRYSSRFYRILVELCTLNIILEFTTWLLRGRVSQPFGLVLNTVYFMITPFPQLIWSLYVETQFGWSKEKLHRFLPMLCFPVVVSEVLMVVNYVTPFIFEVDSGGRYHRLWGYPLIAFFCFSLLGYTIIRIIYNRKKLLDPNLFRALLLFHLPPIIGGALQCLSYGTSFLWPGIALSILIGYVYLQNKRIATDYLTGAYNRLEMDRYTQKIVHQEDCSFWGILIDIDKFKEINDHFGHVAGDEILSATAKLLRSSISPGDFIARYGGDEFLVILNEEDEAKIKHTIEQIENNVANFNRNSRYPFQLSLSMGYDRYDAQQAMDVTEFLKHIDSKMYETKNHKRNNAKRLG